MRSTQLTLILLAAAVLAITQSVQANECSFSGKADSILAVKYVDAGVSGDFDGVELYGPPIVDSTLR